VDEAEHAPEDGDPDSAGDEDERPRRVFGQPEFSLRRLDFDLAPDGKLAQRSLEGAVAHAGGEAEHAFLVR
jgi:hypothetical protein